MLSTAVDSIYGRRTKEVAPGDLQWSPRIGFNWDISGDQRNQLRGGVGMFVGRPAYVWLGNSYQNSGSGLGILNCSGSNSTPGRPPAFDPSAPPPNYCIKRDSTQAQVGLANGVVGPVDLMSKNL